jgi:hypothetical protein
MSAETCLKLRQGQERSPLHFESQPQEPWLASNLYWPFPFLDQHPLHLSPFFQTGYGEGQQFEVAWWVVVLQRYCRNTLLMSGRTPLAAKKRPRTSLYTFSLELKDTLALHVTQVTAISIIIRFLTKSVLALTFRDAHMLHSALDRNGVTFKSMRLDCTACL